MRGFVKLTVSIKEGLLFTLSFIHKKDILMVPLMVSCFCCLKEEIIMMIDQMIDPQIVIYRTNIYTKFHARSVCHASALG